MMLKVLGCSDTKDLKSKLCCIRCYLGRSRQVLLLFVCTHQFGPHFHPPSIDPEELDNVQCVL